jgi:uncharacterized protein
MLPKSPVQVPGSPFPFIETPMTDLSTLIASTEDFVRQRLPADATGHDWHHVFRVRRSALNIGRTVGADLAVVELAALLHDIADHKFHAGDETAGPRTARQWLQENGAPPAVTDQVCAIIAGLSFKGAAVPPEPLSLEGQVVQDADRLDALGAIGIARAFGYGGHAGRPLYDPDVPPQMHASFAAYKSSAAPTLNHFYEKLLLLKDRMHTEAGRRMAQERHAFLEEFLRRFKEEWGLWE